MTNSIQIINQLFEIQSKIMELAEAKSFERNFTRLFNIFEEEGYVIQNPTGEAYSETRTDYEASISGQINSTMKITRTVKPIIYQRLDGNIRLVQKGIVIAGNA